MTPISRFVFGLLGPLQTRASERRQVLRVSLLSLFASALIVSAALAAPRNVILFVTDDQSPDTGCYGNPVIKTPNLDAIAEDGTRFTQAFCTTAS